MKSEKLDVVGGVNVGTHTHYKRGKEGVGQVGAHWLRTAKSWVKTTWPEQTPFHRKHSYPFIMNFNFHSPFLSLSHTHTHTGTHSFPVVLLLNRNNCSALQLLFCLIFTLSSWSKQISMVLMSLFIICFQILCQNLCDN